MRLSSVGPNSIFEALDPERIDPPVRNESIPQPETPQLETALKDSTQTPVRAGNLDNLIEEAKKRADLRKKKGLEMRRAIILKAYFKVDEDGLAEKGVQLDESA